MMKILYVDDEKAALKRFEIYAQRLEIADDVTCLSSPGKAIEAFSSQTYDVAVLDVEMPEMNGIELAKKLKELDENVRVIFITGFHEYALEAFGVDAVGYLVKPYTADSLKKELAKAARIESINRSQIYIQTMPSFEVFVDGKAVPLAHNKQRELLALMVDRRGSSMSASDMIFYLWEDKPDDENTKSLARMTYKRLKERLTELKLAHILNENGNLRAVNTETFSCDYYRLLEGNEADIRKYDGYYMQEYEWAEETNAKISELTEK